MSLITDDFLLNNKTAVKLYEGERFTDLRFPLSFRP